MPGIKIINVFKDDTFPEILELFRKATASEVIFVLPKKSAVFRREDHFAAFASEAASGNKTLSILCNNPDINKLAKKYNFHVMSSAKEPIPKKATLATHIPPNDPVPSDDDIAYNDDDSVVVPADQRPIIEETPEEEEEELGPGMHVEDETPDDMIKEKDLQEDYSADSEFVSAGKQEIRADLAASLDGVRPVAPAKNVQIKAQAEKPMRVDVDRSGGDLDYIDAVWREKAAKIAGSQKGSFRPQFLAKSHWWQFWKHTGLSTTSISKRLAIGVLGGSLAILLFIVYLVVGSATITLKPVAKAVQTDIPIQVSDTFSSVDSNFGKIPGQMFEITKTGSGQIAATGQRDIASKARGKLTIYNEYSSAAQPLIATTRFESTDGLIFRTLQTVTVPGSSVKDGQVVPGSITVDIIADKPGSQYNIQPGKFTIPAFKENGDTDRYAKIYGQSEDAFSGGANGPSQVVTQADYDSAKAAALRSATEQIMTAFHQQSSDLTILDGVEPTITSVKSTANPDDAADSVTVTVTATLDTVAFRQDDLYRLIKDTVSRKERLDVFPDKMDIKYTDIAYKSDLGTLSFTAQISGTGYMPLDTQAILQDIKGKNSQQFKDYFKDKEGVESATLSFSTFWVRSVPDNPDRIKINVDYSSDGQ